MTNANKVFIECGCCGHYHYSNWYGDCRDDSQRFHFEDLPEDAEITDLDEQMMEDE